MNEVKKLWYAVTNMDNGNYDWNFGSENLDEAIEMLKQEGQGEITVIEERYENGKKIDNCAIDVIEIF